MVEITGDITLSYDSKEHANMIQQALKIDDGLFVSSEIKNRSLLAHVESKKLSSFLHTVDDYLSCVSVAESVIDKSDIKK